jgi:phasin family protein
MNANPEQFQSWTRANVESILDLAANQFDAFEKLAGLNTAAAKETLDKAIENARVLVAAKDAQELMSLQNGFAPPALDKAIAYSTSMYRTAAHAQAEALKIAERRVAEWNESVVALLDITAKSAPVGLEATLGVIKQQLAAANLACDNFNKVARHATRIADESVGAASETLKSMPRAKKAA